MRQPTNAGTTGGGPDCPDTPTGRADTAPGGRTEARPSLDREPYQSLVKAVLAWDEPDAALPPDDCEQIALQLAGHAHAVADAVRHLADHLPEDSPTRTLTEHVLAQANKQLSAPRKRTVYCLQAHARLVRDLYERLDRLEQPHPRSGPVPSSADPGVVAPARLNQGE